MVKRPLLPRCSGLAVHLPWDEKGINWSHVQASKASLPLDASTRGSFSRCPEDLGSETGSLLANGWVRFPLLH